MPRSSISRPRRRPISWPVCLAILALVASIGLCKPTGSADFPEDSFSSLPASSSSSSSSSVQPQQQQQQQQRKTLDQEIGSPSELAWRAWLLVENKAGGASQAALDSSNILRRITPKSIFIAPDLVSCPSGYSVDAKGGCKPDPVNIDVQAQQQFLLKRLNNLYGKNGNNRKKPAESGPLQINIPFALPAKTSPPQEPAAQKPETIPADRLAIPIVISQQAPIPLDSGKNQEALAVVVYKLTNDTKKEESVQDPDKATFSPPGSSSSPASKKVAVPTGHAVPVAEIIDDVNETFVGVVDYKIPASVQAILNRSDVFEQMKTRRPTEKKADGSMEDSSPTVVLLLSPTKLPTTAAPPREYELPLADRLTTRQEPDDQRENATATETEEEARFEEPDTTIQTVSPLESETPLEQASTASLTSTEKAYTDDRLDEDTAYTDEETHTEPVSEDHEEYDDTTEEAEQDDFGESEDELLKPGEAGMMIPAKNQDLIKKTHQQHQKPTTIEQEDEQEETTSRTMLDATITPPIPTIDTQSTLIASESTIKSESTTYTKEEDMASTLMSELPTVISTEAEETTSPTLATRPFRAESLRTSTSRAQPTQIPTTTTTTTTTTTPLVDSRERTEAAKTTLDAERDLVTEPEVVLSTQVSRGMTASYGRKRPTHPAKLRETSQPSAPKAELPPYPDFLRQPEPKRPKPPAMLASDSEPIFFRNDGSIPSEFKDQIVESSRPAFTDFRRVPAVNEDSYVRFPEQQTELRAQSGYVRFPSDEVNSIHNQDSYKEHLLSAYRAREDYAGQQTTSSTKSSVPARQKQSSTNWRVPPAGMRTDRQQQQQQQQSQTSGQQRQQQQQQQKQKPMLLRFWARMPLVRDLSFYPTTSHGSHNEPIGGAEEELRLDSRFAQPTTAVARRLNYYRETASHDVDRLLAQQQQQQQQQLDQSAIAG